jgi:hypothetical protein
MDEAGSIGAFTYTQHLANSIDHHADILTLDVHYDDASLRRDLLDADAKALPQVNNRYDTAAEVNHAFNEFRRVRYVSNVLHPDNLSYRADAHTVDLSRQLEYDKLSLRRFTDHASTSSSRSMCVYRSGIPMPPDTRQIVRLLGPESALERDTCCCRDSAIRPN